MDDCSTEPFEEAIKPYEETLHIKKVKTEKNLGTGMARQFGVDNADGDWIIFCDHDDFLYLILLIGSEQLSVITPAAI